MEELAIKTIPDYLLARILVQLYTLPPKESTDVLKILSAGLQIYGNTDNINAFLDYCSTLTAASSSSTDQDTAYSWLWKNYEINNDLDWDLANNKKPQELVGLRFLLTSETARKNVQLTRYGRNTVLDPKCVYRYNGRILPVDSILNETLDYLKQEHQNNDNQQIDELVEQLIKLRLEQFSRDKLKFQQESNEMDDTTYHLMGVLMTRYDSLTSHSSKSWCLYLRDYTMSEDGASWRILYKDSEEMVLSEQALADIQGIPNGSLQPSESSKEYRPVYLFYINQALIAPTTVVEEEVKETEQHITLDDYTFDDEYDYLLNEQQDQQQSTLTQEELEETCLHCYNKDAHDPGNDMFLCDNCNRGVHQLCENPPIEDFEKEADPWYCRSCSEKLNIPLPVPPKESSFDATAWLTSQFGGAPLSTPYNGNVEPTSQFGGVPLPTPYNENVEPTSQQNVLPSKRKRDDEELEQPQDKK